MTSDSPAVDPLTKRLLDAETTLRDITSSLRLDPEDLRVKLKGILKALEVEFPMDGTMRAAEERAMAVYTLKWMFRAPAVLHSLNMNGPAVIDLYGLLERYAVRDVARQLSRSEEARIAIVKLLSRRSLMDVTPVLESLRLWEKKDIRVVKNFTALRNALAHKNAEVLSKRILSGKPIKRLDDFQRATANIDFPPLFAKATRLLVKLYRGYESRRNHSDKRSRTTA